MLQRIDKLRPQIAVNSVGRGQGFETESHGRTLRWSVERETGLTAPSTSAPVEFIYRID